MRESAGTCMGERRERERGMKIAVLGCGAMGGLFGGYLSRCHEVVLVDVNRALVDKIKAEGLVIEEPDGSRAVYRPEITDNAHGMRPADLVIVFVKSMYSRAALQANQTLIDGHTYVMTLQNGSGHEETLREFVDDAHIIIGTTQHNSAVIEMGYIRHGGSGITHMGGLAGDAVRLQPFADAFTQCGLLADCCEGVQRLIWQKMFTNVSASVLTGILQVPLGYIASNPDAWGICETLIREAVAVANGDGMGFDAEEKIREVRAVCEKSPEGITSICADLRDGRPSEVDTISGSVVRASERNGVSAPGHRMIVKMVHAMEKRPDSQEHSKLI